MTGNQDAGEVRTTPLDPDRKSGHYVAVPTRPDHRCWCGEIHYYAAKEGR